MDRKTESLYYYYYYCVWKIILYGQRPKKEQRTMLLMMMMVNGWFHIFSISTFFLSSGQRKRNINYVSILFSSFLFLSLFAIPPLPYVQQQKQERLFNSFFFLLSFSNSLTVSATLPFPLGSPEDDENDDGGDSSKTSFPFTRIYFFVL